jgi:hypothetical protein
MYNMVTSSRIPYGMTPVPANFHVKGLCHHVCMFYRSKIVCHKIKKESFVFVLGDAKKKTDHS